MNEFINRNRYTLLGVIFAVFILIGAFNAHGDEITDFNLVIDTCDALDLDECQHNRNRDGGVNLDTPIVSLANDFCDASLAIDAFDFNSVNGEVCE